MCGLHATGATGTAEFGIVHSSSLQFRTNDWFSGGNSNSESATADGSFIGADIADSGNNSKVALLMDNHSKGIDNTVGNAQSCMNIIFIVL